MLTLSGDFEKQSIINNTKKVLIAHLYKSDKGFPYPPIEYLATSTSETIIDGRQHYGILKNIVGLNQKWNIESMNNVTISSPTLTIIDYETPTGFTIFDDFNQYNYFGNRIEIYFGFAGQTLANMLKLFDGKIDNIAFNEREIVVKCKSVNFPSVSINGSKIDFDKNSIGILSSSDIVIKENNNKFLPVPFGKHWNSPTLRMTKDSASNTNFAISDSNYSDLMMSSSGGQTVSSDGWPLNYSYKPNIDSNEITAYVANEDFYTPLHNQDWSGTRNVFYKNDYRPNGSGSNIPIIKLMSQLNTSHSLADDSIYLHCPVRFLVDEYETWTSSYAHQFTGSDIPYLFRGPWDDSLGSVVTASCQQYAWVKAYINTTIDIEKQLRTDHNEGIYSNRKIHVPKTDAFSDSMLLMGQWDIIPAPSYPYWSYFPFMMFSWTNNFLPDISASAYSSSYVYRNEFIGVSFFGDQSSGNFPRYEQNTRVYGSNLASVKSEYKFTNWQDENDLDSLSYAGQEMITSSMGVLPSLNREALNRNVSSRIQIFNHNPDDNTQVLNAWKLYMVKAGDVSFATDDSLYVQLSGVSLKDSDEMTSTTGKGTEYELKRPYEYLEFLLRSKASASLFDTTFGDASSSWEEFFGTTRDGSGFVTPLETQINLDAFISEYIKYEPFTIFGDENNKYHIPMLKKQYVETDLIGDLDYEDASRILFNSTAQSKIFNEIAVHTDYNYGFKNFCNEINYAIATSSYKYNYWDIENTFDKNRFIAKDMKLKHTSFIETSQVISGSSIYSCQQNSLGIDPKTNQKYWKENPLGLPGTRATSFSKNSSYIGQENEAKVRASFYLNQWCNRHNIVTFETTQLTYLKYEIGDVIGFKNVPYSLLGQKIRGFDENINFESTLNEQAVYGAFMIIMTDKSSEKIKLVCMQLHNLESFNIVRK